METNQDQKYMNVHSDHILCTCLDGAVELVCPHDPRSYVGGALCPGRFNQAEQVAGGGARQKGTHVEIPAGRGWMN